MKRIRRVYGSLGYMAVIFLFFWLSGILCGHWTRLEMVSSYDNTPYREDAVMFLLSAPGGAGFPGPDGGGAKRRSLRLRHTSGR